MFLDEMDELEGNDIKKIHDDTFLSHEEMDPVIDNSVLIMRCITSSREEKYWMRNIFSMFVLWKKKMCKLIIDGGNDMNVISTHAIIRTYFKTEPYPKLFQIN